MKFFLDPSSQRAKGFKKLSEKFEVKDHQSSEKENSAFLVFEDDVLFIKREQLKPIYCDFLQTSFIKEVQQGYGRSEAIFKFLKTKEPLKILDLTLGFGRDFFKAVLAGHEVIGLERDPVIFALLEDGLRRFSLSEESLDLKKRFKVSEFKYKIQNQEASSFLKECDSDFDIIFYDPMFGEGAKSGKAKKSVQFLRDLVEAGDKNEASLIHKLSKPKCNKFIMKSDSQFEFEESHVKMIHKGKGFKFSVY